MKCVRLSKRQKLDATAIVDQGMNLGRSILAGEGAAGLVLMTDCA